MLMIKSKNKLGLDWSFQTAEIIYRSCGSIVARAVNENIFLGLKDIKGSVP